MDWYCSHNYLTISGYEQLSWVLHLTESCSLIHKIRRPLECQSETSLHQDFRIMWCDPRLPWTELKGIMTRVVNVIFTFYMMVRNSYIFRCNCGDLPLSDTFKFEFWIALMWLCARINDFRHHWLNPRSYDYTILQQFCCAMSDEDTVPIHKRFTIVYLLISLLP